MMSQTGQQIITIHILSDISRSKGNLAIKFGQLTKYNLENSFLRKSGRKRGRETSSFLPLYKVKASGQHLTLHIF